MATTTGPNMGVLIGAAQGDAHYAELQKFLRASDGFLMPYVIATQNSPPGSPSDGDMYIVGASPTGAWTGHANAVARYYNGGATWEFFTPHNGWVLRDRGAARFVFFNGTTWASDMSGVLYKNRSQGSLTTSFPTVNLSVTGVDCVNNYVIVDSNSSTNFAYDVHSQTTSGCVITVTLIVAPSANYDFLVTVVTP